MEIDSNVQAGLISGFLGSCYAFVTHIPVLFGGEPIPKNAVKKAVAEILVAFPITFLVAYGLAEPLSHGVTSTLQPVWQGVSFDKTAAGVLLGITGIHTIRGTVIHVLKRWINK